jgi:hypothetical protein
MENGGELRGEKWISLKPLLAMPTITYLRGSYPKAICKKGLMKKELVPETQHFKITQKEVTGITGPTPTMKGDMCS